METWWCPKGDESRRVQVKREIVSGPVEQWKSTFLDHVLFSDKSGSFWLSFIASSHVSKDLLNTQICFILFTYKFHFIATVVLSRQFTWGWLLFFICSKTHSVSLYNTRYVKETIAYKHAAWWVLMLHYIYCFLFTASGNMTNVFPRNKICKIR